ncbi:MAG TPA: hypothetical protein PK252_08680 [Bacteroidales bacterium]|nr:hypothetical protein [Bacteroidales bacterium]
MNKLMSLIAFCFPGILFAQENLSYERKMSAYTDSVSKKFGVIFNIPDKFTDLNIFYIPWKVRMDDAKYIGSVYGPIFLSNDKQCILMYPAQPWYVSKEDREIYIKTAAINDIMNNTTTSVESQGTMNNSFPRSQITAEIKTALGLYYGYGHPLNNDSARMDFNGYVTIVAGKKAREMFNADSIYIYDIPGGDSVCFLDESLEKMRKDIYLYCTGLFIIKKDRGTIDIKLLFTKEGKKREDEYINLLSKQIWYDDNFKHE